jgi:1-acyl-sn-glycerol-3-phosphate acyltransferase
MGTVCLGMLFSDLVQRFVIGPWLWLRPQSRQRVLGRWLQILEWLVTRPLETIGGASLPPRHRVVPCRPGVLIVLNHQSLLDIPLGVRTLNSGYLRLVTRRRYSRFIPLISHLIRLYRNPLVDPTATAGDGRRMLKRLRTIARESEAPIMIFPEGTRSKDGEIGPFRPAGLRLILRAREFEVHAFVIDGLWRHAKFKHLLGNLNEIQPRMEYVGRFDWKDPKGDPESFVADMRNRMVDTLAEMRELEPHLTAPIDSSLHPSRSSPLTISRATE